MSTSVTAEWLECSRLLRQPGFELSPPRRILWAMCWFAQRNVHSSCCWRWLHSGFFWANKRVEEGLFRKGRHALQLQLSTLVVLHVKKQPALGRGLAAPVLVALGCQGRVEPLFSEFITQWNSFSRRGGNASSPGGIKPGSPVPWENAPIQKLVNRDHFVFHGVAHGVQEPWGVLYWTKVEDEKAAYFLDPGWTCR